MRILILSHMYPNNINPVYGVFVHQQALALNKVGGQCQVICPVSYAPYPLTVVKAKWRNCASISRETIIDGIPIKYPRVLNLPGGSLVHTMGALWYYNLRRMVQSLHAQFPFEIIHSHVALPDGHAGVLLAKELGLPTLTFIHGNDFHATLRRGKKYRAALCRVIAKSDRVVTVSDKLKGIGVSLFGDSSPFVTIPNGVDLQRVYQGRSSLKEEYEGKVILLAVGNLKEPKGIDLIIKALARLAKGHPQLQLLIIGQGPEGNALRSLADQLNLANQVAFLGQLTHAQVMEYMSVADVFVLPSWEEGFGVVYIEAMAHGVPVIACQGQGIADVIVDGENGILVEPQSVESLVAALEKLLSNRNWAQKLGVRGQEYVSTHLTWEENAIKVLELSRELVK